MSFDSDIATPGSEDLIDVFGVSARYLPHDGSNVVITVVFDRVPNTIETDEGEFQTFDASMQCKTSDLPAGAEGQLIIIEGTRYCISLAEPDTGGVVNCRLHRAN